MVWGREAVMERGSEKGDLTKHLNRTVDFVGWGGVREVRIIMGGEVKRRVWGVKGS